ncbi:MAG: phage minor head protein [Methylobacter sp.]|uniref:phage head morphogenesis protein n=1 Tax=Methylobacter sp. TaxID=2051955 RepID=UPI0025DD3790|nr:phage minor head protein [Methylobacter sp.]MCK9622009.1 phage minor head protein [Methylobacter sp.]
MPLKLSPTQIAFNSRGDGKFNQPFDEQVEFLKQKLNIPTDKWDDILKAAHDRAFTVAGAAKADLLNDLHTAVNKAAQDGKSIGWFKENFEAIVQKHGWEGWTGSDTLPGRDWRARVIYNTNLRASYAAGRYGELTNPDLLKSRPYWKYVHNDTVAHPRPQHKAWGDKPVVLRYDDPWWQSHFPPNGFGCRCRVAAVRAKEYNGDAAPNDGTYTVEDRNGVKHTLPNGVDYGWDYSQGKSIAKQMQQFVDNKVASLPSVLADAFLAEIAKIIKDDPSNTK